MKKIVLKLLLHAIAAALAVEALSLSETARLAIALGIGLPSLILLIVSRRQLGTSFSVRPKANALITTGLYSKIRDPLYLFLDLLLLALIIALQWPIALLAWAILVLVQTRQAHREEKVLAEAFGAQYERYKKQTWF